MLESKATESRHVDYLGLINLILLNITLFVSGCGSRPDPSLHDVKKTQQLTVPAVKLEKPSPKQHIKVGDPLELAGRVEVREGNWTPSLSVFEITIAKDKAAKNVVLSSILSLTPSESPGVYKFEMKRRANMRAGKYYIQFAMYNSADNSRVSQGRSDIQEFEMVPK